MAHHERHDSTANESIAERVSLRRVIYDDDDDQLRHRNNRVHFADDVGGQIDSHRSISCDEETDEDTGLVDALEYWDHPPRPLWDHLFGELLVWRIGIVSLQFVFNWWDFSTDAFKGILLAREEMTLIDRAIHASIGGFLRWDAVHFIHIAEFDYSFETSLAFFPFFPYLVKFLSHGWSAPFVVFQLMHVSSAYLLTAVALNFCCFLLAGFFLHRIVLSVTRSDKQAAIATLLFSVNPASVFFSAAYSESLFALLTFAGLFMLYDGAMQSAFSLNIRLISATLIFAMAFATRSNGLLNLGYIVFIAGHHFLCGVLDAEWKLADPLTVIHEFGSLVARCILSLFGISALVTWHSIRQWHRFCRPNSAPAEHVLSFGRLHGLVVQGDASIEWCNVKTSLFPPWYSYIQTKYWNVSMFGYWQVKKIPCFLLAAPAIFVVVCGVKRSMEEFAARRSVRSYLSQRCGLLPFAIHATVLAGGAIFLYNVEVFTRILFSSSPFPYLVIAGWMADRTPKVRQSNIFYPQRLPFLSHFCQKKGVLPKALFVYILLYMITGTMMFVTWLPFT